MMADTKKVYAGISRAARNYSVCIMGFARKAKRLCIIQSRFVLRQYGITGLSGKLFFFPDVFGNILIFLFKYPSAEQIGGISKP